MPKSPKRVELPRKAARRYLDKAHEFLQAARDSHAGRKADAAMLNAIHAGISSADAVCVALAGQRSNDPDHMRAVDLLEEIAGNSPAVRDHARQLRRLLNRKNAVEYQSGRASARDAADAVKRAERLTEWAETVLQGANL